MPKVAFPLQHSTGEATSSQPIHKEEEEKEEKEKDIVDVSNSEDLYEVFDHLWTPETTPGDLGQLSPKTTSSPIEMAIQHRPWGSLLEMMESQAKNKVPEATSQAELPYLPTPNDTQQEAAKKKRKRETKGKDVLEEGRDVSSKETEPQRGAKATRTNQSKSQTEMALRDRGHDLRSRIPNWNLVLVLDGSPLPANMSTKDP